MKQKSNLENLADKCIIDAFHHIEEGNKLALNRAVQEINQALCSLFSEHLTNSGVRPATDHDKLVGQMTYYAKPPLDKKLADYLCAAHELRSSAYHASAIPPYYEAFRYFCVAEGIYSTYGFQFPYAKIKSATEIPLRRKILRLLPVGDYAYAYIDYGPTSIRHTIRNIVKPNGLIGYYPADWNLRCNTDLMTEACSPQSIGSLYLWKAGVQGVEITSRSIAPSWALNLIRKRMAPFGINEIKVIRSEKCYFGQSQGVILTLDICHEAKSQHKIWMRGLYGAIGLQPSMEILFMAPPISFNWQADLFSACLFSSHQSVKENGRLIQKIANSVESVICTSHEYRKSEVARMWQGEWRYIGKYPNLFLPDFKVLRKGELLGWGAILTQPSGIEVVVERYAKASVEEALFLVVPKDLIEQSRELCKQYEVGNRGVIGYDADGNLDRLRN